jgi:glycolate oxidase
MHESISLAPYYQAEETKVDNTLIEQFSCALSGSEAVVTDSDVRTTSGHDFWGFGGTPGLLLRPGSRDEVAVVMRLATEHQIPVVPRGGASNCSAGMMPNQDRILLDLRNMNRVLDIDVDTRRARVQPGVINAALQQQLAPYGLCFSPDPVSQSLSTIGGNIIENAGGPHALKYGVTFNHILAVEVVLADGTVITLNADSEGADLLGVLIGSEGTLGIVTEATLALRPVAPVTRSLMGGFATAHDATATVTAIIKTGTVPAALEWLDRAGITGLEQFTSTGYPTTVDAILLIDIDGSAEQVDHDMAVVEQILRRTATEVRRADDDQARARLWYGRLHAPESVLRSGQAFFIGDVTVPRERIPEMQQVIQAAAQRHRDGLSFIAVAGHAGDGDLHPTLFFDRANPDSARALEAANNEIIDAALSMGGTITGEHGVGTEKRQFMTRRFTPVEIAVQRAIKRVFDPDELLNPGVLLPEPTAAEPAVPILEAALRATLDGYRTQTALPTPSKTAESTKRAGGRDISINIANLSVTVGSEVTLDDLARHLADHGVRCAALPATPDERSIGELVATATGTERIAMRNTLLGLDVVLPENDAHARFGGENMKDVAGYDAKRLFTGSHGTFGAMATLIFKISVRA